MGSPMTHEFATADSSHVQYAVKQQRSSREADSEADLAHDSTPVPQASKLPPSAGGVLQPPPANSQASASSHGVPSLSCSFAASNNPSNPYYPAFSASSSISTSGSSAVSESSPSGEDSGAVHPPQNFAEVLPGLYRSSFPQEQHYSYLRSLGLKTVLTFVQDEYPEDNLRFYEEEGITFKHVGMPGNKEDDLRIPDSSIEEALAIALNPNNYPMLMHCNKGKHRTGVIVGCLRKLQKLALEDILEEYRYYSFPKCRTSDQHCISRFNCDNVLKQAHDRAPHWFQHSLPELTTSYHLPNAGRPLQNDSNPSIAST